jgi:hypothetical protein
LNQDLQSTQSRTTMLISDPPQLGTSNWNLHYNPILFGWFLTCQATCFSRNERVFVSFIMANSVYMDWGTERFLVNIAHATNFLVCK